MYMMNRRPKWTIARARQHLPALLGAAAHEPQRVYKRDQHVATVVSADVVAEKAPSLADALAELRRLCEQEEYELPAVRRRDRRKR